MGSTTSTRSSPAGISSSSNKTEGNEDSFTNRDNLLSIIVLGGLTGVYAYLLIDPKQPRLSAKPKNFVLKPDTIESFAKFTKDYSSGSDSSSSGGYSRYYSSGDKNYSHHGMDDFFMTGKDDFKDFYVDDKKMDKRTEPISPSSDYLCQEDGWLAIRAELNYKYLWLHAGEHGWMGATATMDTPLHRRSFEIHPVNESCADGQGWVRLREGDSQGFLMMVAPTGAFAVDEWVVKVGSELLNVTNADPQYHFLLEEEGYMLNRGSMAFVNVMPEAEYSVRGHTGGWDRTKAAGREYGAQVKFSFVNESLVQEAIDEENAELKETEEEDKLYRQQIAAFPKSTEKRVISFGLYGAKEKYTLGAVHNAELAQVYFPGWVRVQMTTYSINISCNFLTHPINAHHLRYTIITPSNPTSLPPSLPLSQICRFYVTSDVPPDTVDALKKLGAEVENVPAGMGYSSGMFWRFMPAADASVDRFVVRDVDSRLNARDRIAVEEWIESKLPVHILRDHVNHCIVMNGGMWGAVKDALPNMKELIMAWSRYNQRASYHTITHPATHANVSSDTDMTTETRPFTPTLSPPLIHLLSLSPSHHMHSPHQS